MIKSHENVISKKKKKKKIHTIMQMQGLETVVSSTQGRPTNKFQQGKCSQVIIHVLTI